MCIPSNRKSRVVCDLSTTVRNEISAVVMFVRSQAYYLGYIFKSCTLEFMGCSAHTG